MLITANHSLPLMLDRSGRHPRLLCADPKLKHLTSLRVPFPIERLLDQDDPPLYLRTFPHQILLPPDGLSSQRQAETVNTHGQRAM